MDPVTVPAPGFFSSAGAMAAPNHASYLTAPAEPGYIIYGRMPFLVESGEPGYARVVPAGFLPCPDFFPSSTTPAPTTSAVTTMTASTSTIFTYRKTPVTPL